MSASADRKPGFYWVRTGRGWSIAHWQGLRWQVIGDQFFYDDRIFDEIGPNVEDQLRSVVDATDLDDLWNAVDPIRTFLGRMSNGSD